MIGDGGPGWIGSRFTSGGGTVTGLVLDADGRAAVSFAVAGTPGDPLAATWQAAASTSAAAASWTPPVSLGPTGEFRSWPRDLASDGNGGAAVVGDAGVHLYEARFAQGSWQAGDDIAMVRDDFVVDAHLLSDDRGAGLAVWVEERVWAAQRAAGGAWLPRVALGDRAQVVVAGTPARALVLSVRQQAITAATVNGGALSALEQVPAATGAVFGVGDACADGGGFQVIWTVYDQAETQADIVTARFVSGSGWQPATVLTAHVQLAGGPGIACGGGNALAHWVTADGKLHATRLTAAGWAKDGGVLVQSVPLPSDPRHGVATEAAVDAQGVSLLAWAANGQILFTRAGPAGRWLAAAPLPGSSGLAGTFRLAGNAAGAAVAAWARARTCTDCGPGPSEIVASRFDPDARN